MKTELIDIENMPCPFCGGILNSSPAIPELGLFQLNHDLPHCKEFQEMGLIDFIQAAVNFWSKDSE